MNATNLEQTFAAAVGGRDRLAGNFAARTFGDLDKRAGREISEAAAFAAEGCEAIERAAKRLGLEDPELLEQLKAEHVGRVRGAWAAYQHAGSRVLNWMVTGPARFPVERNRKRMETEHRRMTEYLAIAKGAGAWAEKRIKRAIRARLGPVGVADAELDQARAKLEQREKRQAMMKAANPIVRKHRAKERGEAIAAIAADLKAAGLPHGPALASSLLTPPWPGGPIGFAPYQLSNNSAEIRRLRARVAELDRKAAAIAAAAELEDPTPCNTAAGDEIRIVENVLEDRLQILFPGKPSSSVRALLKGRGFRWAPSSGAWQRQLTNNARHAAAAIVDQARQEKA